MRELAILFLFMAFVASETASGADPGVENDAASAGLLSLDKLVQEALDQNPDIGAAARRLDAAKAVIPRVQTLPDPQINLEYRDLDTRETMYGFSQELPFPGKLRLRGEIAASEADRSEQEYLATRLGVVAALKEAYYELHFLHKSVDIVGKNSRLLQQFEVAAEARYAVGKGPQQDVFRAQSEVSRVLARLATLEQRIKSMQADINRLLNRPPELMLGVPEDVRATPLLHSSEELRALVEQGAPLYRARLKEVERNDRAVDLARRDYFPDFELGVAGVREEPEGVDGYRVMLNMSVPMYFSTNQRQGVREAIAGKGAALEELYATRQELLFRIQDNVAQMERAAELIRILEQALIPQARLTLASAEAGYAVGAVDFLTLLNSLLTLQDNELELHAEFVEHEKARARLEEIVGETP